MARLRCWKWFTKVSCRAEIVAVPFTTGGSRIRTVRSYSGRGHHRKQEQLWRDLFSKPSAWWDNRLDKRNPRGPDFVCKVTRTALWLNNQFKPKWVDSQLGDLDVRSHSGQGGGQGSLSLDPGRPGDALERLCLEGKLEEALEVLVRMDEQEDAPTESMYRALLTLCAQKKTLALATRVHAHLSENLLESLGESMVDTFVKCGGLEDALQLFHRLENRTSLSWTALISGYVMAGKDQEALWIYHWMQEEGVQPDALTLVHVLKACASMADLKEGRRVHSDASKYRCEDDLVVRTSLIDMYGKCGSLVVARKVFDALSSRHVVEWNAMLTAYAEHGLADKALQLYGQMHKEGVSPNDETFVCVLQVCSAVGENCKDVELDANSYCLERGNA